MSASVCEMNTLHQDIGLTCYTVIVLAVHEVAVGFAYVPDRVAIHVSGPGVFVGQNRKPFFVVQIVYRGGGIEHRRIVRETRALVLVGIVLAVERSIAVARARGREAIRNGIASRRVGVHIVSRSRQIRRFAGRQHTLGQLHLPVGELVVLSFMLPLVRIKLSRALEHVVASGSNAMNVITQQVEAAAGEHTLLVLHELPEAVFGKLLVFDVIGFVFLDVALVLKRRRAVVPNAVEVRCALSVELAIRRLTILGGAEPLESFLNDGDVLAVVVRVHLYVGSRDVAFVTFVVHAVVMGLFPVVNAVRKLDGAVVRWRIAEESVLEAFVALFMPLEMSDHFFFLDKHLDGRGAANIITCFRRSLNCVLYITSAPNYFPHPMPAFARLFIQSNRAASLSIFPPISLEPQ